MRSVQKSLRLVAAIALIASAAGSQAAGPRFVFGKEPVARHNRAVAARRMQVSTGYRMSSGSRMTMPSTTQSYGGTAMVQTYPVPQRSYAPSRQYVTPVAGYRPQMAANKGYIVR